MGIRIDALDATASPSRDHEVPAIKDGLTVKLTVGQILDLIIDSAPGALDTLNELAAALGDDANFATTVTNALALKAPLASPTFTGNPTAPTPSPGDNDTSIATTAFVNTALSAAVFSKSFASAEQTITTGGALTLAHGMAVVPKIVFLELVCTTADAGYSVGDKLAIGFTGAVNSNSGVNITYDATNIYARYGSTAAVFIAGNKGTGSGASLVNTSWRLVVRAYA